MKRLVVWFVLLTSQPVFGYYNSDCAHSVPTPYGMVKDIVLLSFVVVLLYLDGSFVRLMKSFCVVSYPLFSRPCTLRYGVRGFVC